MAYSSHLVTLELDTSLIDGVHHGEVGLELGPELGGGLHGDVGAAREHFTGGRDWKLLLLRWRSGLGQERSAVEFAYSLTEPVGSGTFTLLAGTASVLRIRLLHWLAANVLVLHYCTGWQPLIKSLEMRAPVHACT